MLARAGKRRYCKSPSPPADPSTLWPCTPTTSIGVGPAGGGTHRPRSRQQSCAPVSTGHSFAKCQPLFSAAAAAARTLELLAVPWRWCPSFPIATELTWALGTSFRPSDHIAVRVRGDSKFQMYGKILWAWGQPLGPTWINRATAQNAERLILTRLLVNWNYSTDVFCNCNSANWLFIIFACDCCFQYRVNSFPALICIWVSALQTRVYWLLEHSQETVRGTNPYFPITWKTYPWNHLWPLILSKQLFKLSLGPWQLQRYAGCGSWETLPPWDNHNASDAISLMENESSRTKKSLHFTALELFNMFCFASSIAAWIQDSTHASVNSDLTAYYGHKMQCRAFLQRPSIVRSTDREGPQWQQTIRETLFSAWLTNLETAKYAG